MSIPMGLGQQVAATLATQYRKTSVIALAAVDSGGGVFSWQNPEGVDIEIVSLDLDVTTKASGACTLDCGTTAVSGTTSSNNLMTGVDVGTAAGVFNNNEEKGASGKSKQRLSAGKWVTGSKASGASAGIVGYAYITYIVLN